MEDIKQKVEKYLTRGKPLFDALKKAEGLSDEDSKRADKIMDMAFRYYSDSKHFYENEKYLDALTALEYAEGWMDAGKEIGLLLD